MSLSADQISKLAADAAAAAIAAALGGDDAGEPDAVTAKVLKDAPKARTQSRKAETTAKVATVDRVLDTVTVEAGDGIEFDVVPHVWPSSYSIRVHPFTVDETGKRREQRSLSVALIEAMSDEDTMTALRETIAKVDKAGKITSHPKRETSKSAK